VETMEGTYSEWVA